MRRYTTAFACLMVCASGLFPAQVGISPAFAASNGNGNHNGNGNTGNNNGNNNGNGSPGVSANPGDPGHTSTHTSTGSRNTTTAALGSPVAPAQTDVACAKGHRVEAGLGNGCF